MLIIFISYDFVLSMFRYRQANEIVERDANFISLPGSANPFVGAWAVDGRALLGEITLPTLRVGQFQEI